MFFCLSAKGEILAAVGSGPGEIRVLDDQGKLLRSWKTAVKPEAINTAADGTILVGGEGRLFQFSVVGEVLTEVDAPHTESLRKSTEILREEAIAYLERSKNQNSGSSMKVRIGNEQNGTRLFEFHPTGEAKPEPVATNIQLTPDMSSPVIAGNLAFCINKFLYCLDVSDGLKERCRVRDSAFSTYGSIIASAEKLLVVGDGELLLFNTNGDKTIIGRQRIFEANDRLYSFPAWVGNRLFVRGESHLKCIEFD